MIGSSTLVVKDGSKYRVHILGGIILGDIKAEEFVELDKKYINKPDADNLSEGDVYTILASHQCASEDMADYSKFAGDRKWLLDLQSKSLLSVKDYVKNWKEAHNKAIEDEKRRWNRAVKAKTRRLLKETKENAKVFARELMLFMEGKSKLPVTEKHRGLPSVEYSVKNFSFSSWASDKTQVQFFAPAWSSDNDLIAKHFNFHRDFFPLFLKRNGWRVTVMKAPDWQNRPDTSAFYAKKNGKTIHWNRHMESSLSLVNLETL